MNGGIASLKLHCRTHKLFGGCEVSEKIMNATFYLVWCGRIVTSGDGLENGFVDDFVKREYPPIHRLERIVDSSVHRASGQCSEEAK